MLDQNDLKEIGALVKEGIKENNKELTKEIVGHVVVAVGEFIDENVIPTIGHLIEEKLRPLPDRDFITKQTVEVKGTIVAQLRKEDEKVNLLIKFLREQKVLTEEQWKALRALQVFPSIDL